MIAPDKTIILGLLILRSWKHAMQGLRKITFSSSLSLQGPVLTLWSNHEFLWLDHMLNCQFRKIKTKTLYSLLCNCVTTMILYVCYRNSRCSHFFLGTVIIPVFWNTNMKLPTTRKLIWKFPTGKFRLCQSCPRPTKFCNFELKYVSV